MASRIQRPNPPDLLPRGEWGVHCSEGWLEEAPNTPARFASEAKAKKWIKTETVHPQNYKVKRFKK